MGKDYADLTGMTHQNGNTSPDGHLFSPASIDGSEHGENDKRQAIGRVASPMRSESTSVRCYFWVPRGTLVEKTQLVRTESKVAGGEPISFFGVVEEVYRRSRRRSFDEEFDNFDGEIDYEPPFKAEGVTYAEVSILRSEPPILTPPLEESLVFLSTEADAGATYGYDTMIEHAEDGSEVANWGLPVGLLRNGGTATVGVARIDLRDLVGDRAGHLNVTGQAGRGTKSSFLLVVVRALINFARQWDDGTPGRQPFSVRPIVFNVKGNDLMYIDAPNRHLTGQQRQTWAEMGIEPEPFQRAEFYAPCRPTHGAINRAEPRMLRPRDFESQTKPYYWTLTDVIRFGLWTYLYSEDARNSDTLMAMVDHVLDVLAEDCPPDREHPAGLQLRAPSPDSSGIPQSFQALRIWLRDALANQHHPARDHGIHAHGTCRALLSRLGLVLDQDGRAIFDDGVGTGRPLLVTDGNRSTAPAVARNSSAPREIEPNRGDPLVVDIATLPPDLRRFVVAAVLDQVKANQMGPQRVLGQVYFLVLDELGIYAPRGARDPITKLFEHVAAQLRSQGIILLGAQQHASQVSETIFGNSEFKALGASSPVELESPTWNRLLTGPQKTRALMLRPEEKMILTGGGWMNLVVPFPAWAMKQAEAAPLFDAADPNGRVVDPVVSFNLPEN